MFIFRRKVVTGTLGLNLLMSAEVSPVWVMTKMHFAFVFLEASTTARASASRVESAVTVAV